MKPDPFPLVVALVFYVAVASLALLLPASHAFGYDVATKPAVSADFGAVALPHEQVKR